MLTSLSIGNFKAFGETQTIPIRPITLIFGANSSGKSSIIHSLLLANHGLERGSWDVHKMPHAGDEVDLGGFSQYLHRPRTEDKCTIGFELAPELIHRFIARSTVGKEEEQEPFTRCRRFGITLEISKTPVQPADGGDSDAAALQSIRISFDGQEALQFCRTGPDTFRCEKVFTQNPFIRGLLSSMVAFGSRHDAYEEPQSSLSWEKARELLGQPPPSALELREHEASIAQERDELANLRERTARCVSPEAVEEEVIKLGGVLSAVMSERTFALSQHKLVDRGPDDEWYYPGWREQLEERADGILSFLQERCDPDDVSGQRWVEAQAIRYNLSKVLESLSMWVLAGPTLLSFLGPIRPIPPRHQLGTGQHKARELDSWITLSHEPGAQDSVNRWLGQGWLNTPYRVKPRRLVYADDPTVTVGIPEIQFEDALSGTTLGHPDLGFGINQVLPVLVAAAMQLGPPLKGLTSRIVAIEQPELHLHPAMQAELGDVFIESALGERKNTFLLETHSEHLILRIMRRIRETHLGKLPKEKNLPPVRPSDVAVLYVEKEGPRSIVREFPLNERGELVKAWPGGFFEEGLREMLP